MNLNQSGDALDRDPNWQRTYLVGAAAAAILVVYSIVTMILLVSVGGPPTTAEECFRLLRNNRIVGLLRLDLLTVIAMLLYYPLFFSIYGALKKDHDPGAVFYTALAFIGVTLVIATPSVFSLLSLSDKYEASANVALRTQYLAAGEAIIASDMFHGTGAVIGGILLQAAAVFISTLMLRSKNFGLLIGWTGILTHGLDLAHIIFGLFSPSLGNVFMAIAGPLYLVWFPLVGFRLFRLRKLWHSATSPA